MTWNNDRIKLATKYFEDIESAIAEYGRERVVIIGDEYQYEYKLMTSNIDGEPTRYRFVETNRRAGYKMQPSSNRPETINPYTGRSYTDAENQRASEALNHG